MAVLAAAGVVSGSRAASADSATGLWPASHQAAATECGGYGRDGNNFCHIDDGSVELGVRFTTATPLRITGVRVYRVDSGPMTGSLWEGGTLLATGSFGPYAGHGWQDLVFDAPVDIVPSATYVASYFAPNGDYAFEYRFFTDGPLTVGPVTGLQAGDGGGNGVYCYAGESCFPTFSSRETNYWVTPLWEAYDFDGFHAPVDDAVWNRARAGTAIPVKFSLGGDFGLDILKAGYPQAQRVACPGAGTPSDPVEQTVSAGASGLGYDPAADEYVYVWKTDKQWAGRCYRFELGLDDGSSHAFDVRFK